MAATRLSTDSSTNAGLKESVQRSATDGRPTYPVFPAGGIRRQLSGSVDAAKLSLRKLVEGYKIHRWVRSFLGRSGRFGCLFLLPRGPIMINSTAVELEMIIATLTSVFGVHTLACRIFVLIRAPARHLAPCRNV
jgi:hypothetical protein